MKIKNTNYHLAYCTNIHSGETWFEVFENLKRYLLPIKGQLSPDLHFGVGLRLSHLAAKQLQLGEQLKYFKGWLSENGLYVFTLNGFPYGKFHANVVKEQVYLVDWTNQNRYTYTVELASILSELLPVALEGSISTLPLTYKPWILNGMGNSVYMECALNLAKVAEYLIAIRQKTGKLLYLAIEPEPNCLIESSIEFVDFYQDWLLVTGKNYLQKFLKMSSEQADVSLREHIRVCYDICHFSVVFEDPFQALAKFERAGIKIGKVQLSSALRVSIPRAVESRRKIVEQFKLFSSSSYLHQVVEIYSDGTKKYQGDLVDVLSKFEVTNAIEWRIHYHVPLFLEHYDLLCSTQKDIIDVLKILNGRKLTQHLEIETYTWEVLPDTLKVNIIDSIKREYNWVLHVLGVSKTKEISYKQA